MMNWAYIAGFFDGDGCLSYTPRNDGSCRLGRAQFTQSGPQGTALLLEIQEFLEEQGIASRLITKQREDRHRQVSNDLAMASRRSVVGLLRGMSPWLRVKKTLAQDHLRYFTLYPLQRGDRSVPLVSFQPLDGDQNFWAYVAGLFDAEGCLIAFNNTPDGNRHMGMVDIGQSGDRGRLLLEPLRGEMIERGLAVMKIAFSRSRKPTE